MTYIESLEKFGLSDDYTLEDLKAKYRNLIKTYHPDLFLRDSIEYENALEETQSINIAYGILEEHLNRNREDVVNKSNDIHYVLKVFQIMKNYVARVFEISILFPGLLFKIRELLKMQFHLSSYSNMVEVDQKLEEFRHSVVEINKLIEKRVYDLNNVNYEDYKDASVDYDKPIYEFWHSINERVSKRDSKSEKFKKLLKKETSAYQSYPFFRYIKGIIEELVTEMVNELENGNKVIDELVVLFNERIKDEYNKCSQIMSLVYRFDKGVLNIEDLNRLDDIVLNYSKYGYKRSLSIIESIRQRLENDLNISDDVEVYVKKNSSFLGPDFVFKVLNDDEKFFYFITPNNKLSILDAGIYSWVNTIYVSLEEFIKGSQFLGAKADTGHEECELLYDNNNSVVVRHKDGSISLESLRDFTLKKSPIDYVSYEDFSREILLKFYEAQLSTDNFSKSKRL